MQTAEDGGFAATKVFSVADTLVVGVSCGEFERDVAGGKPEAVNPRSAPISDELDTVAWLPEAASHVFGEVDRLGSQGTHGLIVWRLTSGSARMPLPQRPPWAPLG